jgi:hypothetical protein
MKRLVKFSVVPLLLSCIAVLLSACAFSASSLVQLVMGGSPTPNTSLLPADHGLPDTIAGYRVLSVRNSETTACIPPGTVIVTLEVDAPNVEEAMSTDVDAIRQELEHLDPDGGVRWVVEIVGGADVDLEARVAGNALWNEVFTEQACARLSGPLETLQPLSP